MCAIIESFRKEHEAILFNFREVKRLGVHTMEGRNQLMNARRELLAHLEKEDELLYPGLARAAETNPELKNTLAGLDREMKEISEFCATFFEKYEIHGGGIDFFRDFDTLHTALENRIKKEEQLLYDQYNRLNK